MNHALLKSVIYDQHEFIRDFQIVPRNYEFEENGNYVLVGLRRAGKSTLLYKIVLDLVASGVDWEQIIYINFEDERLSEFTVADFNDLLSVQSEMSDKKGYFFLDEVQNIDGWARSICNTAACRNRCCTRQNGSIFPAFTKKCCWATSSRGTASATTMR